MTFTKQQEKPLLQKRFTNSRRQLHGIPFIAHLKDNISSRFASHDIVSAMAIFDPRKVPSADSTQLTMARTQLKYSSITMGKTSLLSH